MFAIMKTQLLETPQLAQFLLSSQNFVNSFQRVIAVTSIIC